MSRYLNWIILLIAFLSLDLFGDAPSAYRSYGVESALVNYEIKGVGVLSGENNLSIEGKASLVFDDWGARRYIAEKYIESTQGSVKNAKTVRTLYREEYGNIFSVDFEKEKVETSRDMILIDAIKSGKDVYGEQMQRLGEKGKREGVNVILGWQCEEWLIDKKKICYHKGVPLKEEYVISGISVTKTAILVEFDKNITEDTFALPDFEYGKQQGFLIDGMQSVQKTSTETNESNETDEFQEEEIEVLQLAQNMFEQHKILLPKLLREMLEARVCLENAKEKSEANRCISKLVEVEEQISGEADKESEIQVWTEVAKEKKLEELEGTIMDLKRRMPCIHRSRDFDDLTACMQDD